MAGTDNLLGTLTPTGTGPQSLSCHLFREQPCFRTTGTVREAFLEQNTDLDTPYRRLSAISRCLRNLPCSTLGLSAQDHGPRRAASLLLHLLLSPLHVACGGGEPCRGSACTRVCVDLQAHPGEHAADTGKTFLVPLLTSAWHRVPSMVTSVQRGALLSLSTVLSAPDPSLVCSQHSLVATTQSLAW